MLVKDWMSKDPVTINDDTSMMKAIHLMKQNRFRRLPVLHEGRLVGIVSDRDLKEASPSKATTLDVHELYYLLAELHVKDIMTRDPVTVDPGGHRGARRPAHAGKHHFRAARGGRPGQGGGHSHPIGRLPGLHAHYRHTAGGGAVCPAPGGPARA